MQSNPAFDASYREYLAARRPRSMTVNARCAILATPYRDVPAMQCPTTPYRFHYHGHDPAGPYRATTRTLAPCQHRHKSLQAAIACTERLASSCDCRDCHGATPGQAGECWCTPECIRGER